MNKQKDSRKGDNARNAVDDMLGGLTADMFGSASNEEKQQIIQAMSSDNLGVGAFRFTPVGLKIDGAISRDDWEETGRILKMLDTSMQWLIGDFIVQGENLEYGDQKKIAEQFGFEYGTVRVYASVARNVPLLIRINSLTFAHHQLVAGKDEKDQRYWLNLAVDENLSVAKLREKINPPDDSLPSALDVFIDRVSKVAKVAKTLKGNQKEQAIRFLRELLKSLES